MFVVARAIVRIAVPPVTFPMVSGYGSVHALVRKIEGPVRPPRDPFVIEEMWIRSGDGRTFSEFAESV